MLDGQTDRLYRRNLSVCASEQIYDHHDKLSLGPYLSLSLSHTHQFTWRHEEWERERESLFILRGTRVHTGGELERRRRRRKEESQDRVIKVMHRRESSETTFTIFLSSSQLKIIVATLIGVILRRMRRRRRRRRRRTSRNLTDDRWSWTGGRTKLSKRNNCSDVISTHTFQLCSNYHSVPSLCLSLSLPVCVFCERTTPSSSSSSSSSLSLWIFSSEEK